MDTFDESVQKLREQSFDIYMSKLLLVHHRQIKILEKNSPGCPILLDYLREARLVRESIEKQRGDYGSGWS